jgi:hypothetical protein
MARGVGLRFVADDRDFCFSAAEHSAAFGDTQ